MTIREYRIRFSTNRVAVLFIDDGSERLDLFRKCLGTKEERFLVERVTSADDAREKLEKSDNIVIISDYVILGMDGLKLLEEFRKRGNKIPFIFFSADDNKDDLIRVLNLDRTQFIRKSSDRESNFDKLARVIIKAVESRNHSWCAKKHRLCLSFTYRDHLNYELT